MWYVVKPFADTFGFCQSKMATFSSLFVSKNVITKIKKACLKLLMIINITSGSNSYIRDIIYHNIMLSNVRGTITSHYFTMTSLTS